jgi:hypothetical protein
LYLNGKSQGKASNSNVSANVLERISMGVLFYAAGSPWDCKNTVVHSAQIFNAALTPGQVRSLASGVSPKSIAPLLVDWRLDSSVSVSNGLYRVAVSGGAAPSSIDNGLPSNL